MSNDIVRDFGHLCLGSRFRRIGERLQADTQAIIDGFDLPVQAGQYPCLAALDRDGPLTVGDLAETLGITQPGITRMLGQLTRAGLVEARTSDEDQRRKLVSLTPAGNELVAFSRREVWPRIERSVAALCGDLAGPLLDQLAAIEDGLATASLSDRVKDQMETTR